MQAKKQKNNKKRGNYKMVKTRDIRQVMVSKVFNIVICRLYVADILVSTSGRHESRPQHSRRQ